MKILDRIDAKLGAWIEQQRIFFVGSAPLSGDGHVNLSPKGGDAFRILGPLEVAYQDYTGSGAETAAHLRENGRIAILFCAFDGPPRIARLHGRGSVVLPGDARFLDLAQRFPENPGTRAIVHIEVTRVSTSCGYSVPCYQYLDDRDVLDKWALAKGTEGLDHYREKNNRVSIDGLPGLK